MPVKTKILDEDNQQQQKRKKKGECCKMKLGKYIYAMKYKNEKCI